MSRLLALAALALAACSNGQVSCKLQSDCPVTERCVSSVCTIVCRIDRDCEGGEQCVDYDCVPAATGGGSGGGGNTGGGASDSGVVDAGNSMGGGSASTGGGTSTDAGHAGGGSAATGGGSALGGGSAAMGGGSAAGGGGAAMGGGSATGGGSGATGGGGTMLGQYGDPCSHQTDCASGLCVTENGGTQGLCTINCTDESQCHPKQSCLPVDGVNICVPSDSGHACPSGSGTECFAGICLQFAGSVAQSVCATPCESTRSCPAQFSCSAVQVGSQLETLCTPVGQTCSAAAGCITNLCSTQLVTTTDGVCTNTCTDATDCPSGWSCGLEDFNNGNGTVSACQPVGEACSDATGMNNCYSQTCAITSGSTGYCTAFCMSPTGTEQAARCSTGFTCTAESFMSSTVYVCEM